jgi:nitroreductase
MSNELDVSKLTIDEILAKFSLSEDEYRTMDETEFRARFRERLHHTLEIQTYAAIHFKKPLKEQQTGTIEKLAAIWRERGIPQDLPDYRTAERILSFAEKAKKNEAVDLEPYAPHKVSQQEYEAFQKILTERRSVRHWTEEEVGDDVINEVLKAGLWAAHSCNLQSIRYAVIREKNAPGLFRGSDIPGGPVHLMVLQDYRVYRANPLNPERNRLLDAGAAVQNLVLAAHALGLGGVWLTYNDAMIQRLREYLQLPEYIGIVTYVDVGWPAQTPAPLERTGLDEAVLARI